jgi:hypothetical protein
MKVKGKEERIVSIWSNNSGYSAKNSGHCFQRNISKSINFVIIPKELICRMMQITLICLSNCLIDVRDSRKE